MKDISWTTCLRVSATAVGVCLICAGRETLLALLSSVMGALTPLLIGGGVACVAEIPVNALEKRLFPHGGSVGRGVCLALTLLGMAAAAAWLVGGIAPELLRCLTLLAGGLPDLLDWLISCLRTHGAAQWLAELPDGQELLSLAGGMLQRAMDALSALTSGAANAALSLVFAAYLLAGKERMAAQAKALVRHLPERAADRLLSALSALRDSLRVYIAGQCVEALLLGGLCLLGMMLLGLPQALTISAMAGVSALIPLAGTPVAAVAGAMLLLPEGASAATTFVIFFLILQQVESNFIYPRVVSATLGLSPIWMLTAMLVGGALSGLPGAMLAVPLTAAAKTLLNPSSPAPPTN